MVTTPDIQKECPNCENTHTFFGNTIYIQCQCGWVYKEGKWSSPRERLTPVEGVSVEKPSTGKTPDLEQKILEKIHNNWIAGGYGLRERVDIETIEADVLSVIKEIRIATALDANSQLSSSTLSFEGEQMLCVGISKWKKFISKQ